MLKALYTPKKCILSSKRVQSYKLRRKNQIYKPKFSTKSLILRHLWSLLLLFTQISHHFKPTDVHKTVYLKAIFDLKAYHGKEYHNTLQKYRTFAQSAYWLHLRGGL